MAIIHLLDDDVAVTDACAFLLESLGYPVTCWEEGAVFLEQAELYQTGVLLLDMRMPVMDGKHVHEVLRLRESTLAVVFLTGHGDVPMAVEQMKLGAVDFLQKPVSARPLQTALEQIATCYRGLTVKERELAGFVVKGLMNREIAQVMNIAVRTVEVHRARVMEKMQAANLAELVNKWQQLKETRIVE